jgi:hypothetical protein
VQNRHLIATNFNFVPPRSAGMPTRLIKSRYFRISFAIPAFSSAGPLPMDSGPA